MDRSTVSGSVSFSNGLAEAQAGMSCIAGATSDAWKEIFRGNWKWSGLLQKKKPVFYEVANPGWEASVARAFLKARGEPRWSSVRTGDYVLIAKQSPRLGAAGPIGLIAFRFEVSGRSDRIGGAVRPA